MKKLMWLIVVIALLMLAGLLTLSLTAEPPTTLGRNADGQLPPCPDSPNCVCSYDTDAEHAIEPFTMTGDPKSEIQRLARFISDHQRARVVTIEDDYVLAEFTSQIFRYTDDVEFLADPDGKTLHVRSASRVGHSDMGANRQRIEILRIQFHSGNDDLDPDVPDDDVVAVNSAKDATADADSNLRGRRPGIGFETVDDESELVVIRSISSKNRTGRDAAERDIAAGNLFLLEQPLPNPPWWNVYSKLLSDECGVTIEVIKHDRPKFSDDDIEYNTLMKTAIERKFGTGIISKLKKRAQGK